MGTTAISPGYDVGSAQVIGGFKFSVASESSPIVFVLDEDAAVRESLALLVVGEGWRCETFASAQQFFKRPAALAPNCLVLDAFSCPNALDVQRRIAFDHPDTSVIFLTGSIDIATTVKAMKAGAVEFFTKPFRDDLLLAAIREALQCSRIALGHEAGMQELRDRYATLTAREQQVMVLVVSGLLNKCIAGELGISEITVKAHRGQVMQKMKANSLADLVKMALKLQVTDLP